jgi:hypothetical protein
MRIEIDVANHDGQYVADDEVFFGWKDRGHAETPDGPVPVFLDAGLGKGPAGRGSSEIVHQKEAANQKDDKKYDTYPPAPGRGNPLLRRGGRCFGAI